MVDRKNYIIQRGIRMRNDSPSEFFKQSEPLRCMLSAAHKKISISLVTQHVADRGEAMGFSLWRWTGVRAELLRMRNSKYASILFIPLVT